MPVPHSRAITDTTQGAFNRESRKEIEQIKREIVKPKVDPPAAGGFDPGTTVVTGTTYQQTTVGSTTTVYGNDWTIAPAAGSITANAPGVTVSADPGRLIMTDAGLYMIEWRQSFSFPSSAPSVVSMTFNYVSAEYLARKTVAILAADGYLLAEPGAKDTLSIGPVNMDAGEEFYPRLAWASTGHITQDVGMFLRITKLG